MTQFRTNAVTQPIPEQIAQRVGDAGIIGSLFVAPLWFGGRHDLGYLLYAVAVAVAAIGVFSHEALAGRTPRLSRAALVLIGAAFALLTLQCVPLPASLYAWLAPYATDVFPPSIGSGPWRMLSVAPAETREGLALLACHALLLSTAAARLRSADDVRRLLAWIGYAATAMAAIALVQYAAGNGKLLWVYDHPHREMGVAVQGVFSNRNHFAQFVALALGPLCLLIVHGSRGALSRQPSGRRRGAVVAMLALVLVAGLATQSRGGAIAIGVAALASALVAWRCGAIKRSHGFAAVFVSLAILGGLSFVGYDGVAERLDDVASGDVETLDANGARRAIWAANVEALRASPLVGFGAGSHRDVYPLFMEEDRGREFTHAESGYLQIASETGAAGLSLLIAVGSLIIGWVAIGLSTEPDHDRRRLWIGVVPGLAASAVHAVVDFVWYTPGIMAITVALAACAMRLSDMALAGRSANARSRRERGGSGGFAFARVAVVTTLAAVSIGVLLPPARGALAWDRYLRVSSALRGVTQRLARNSANADASLAETLVVNTAHTTDVLEEVVASDPSNGRAHLRLAGRLLQRFELESTRTENGMAIELIADAATSGGFATHGAMLAWLDRAFGERADYLRRAHAHARRAVELCPMQGEGYLYLATLAFLDPAGPDPADLVRRALVVRPNDGEVLFEAGRQRRLAGDHAAALRLWRKCVNRPGSHQLKLVAMLTSVMPAEQFVAMLEPELAVTQLASKRYEAVGSDDDRAALGRHALALAEAAEAAGDERPVRLAAYWSLVSRSFRGVGDAAGAVAAAERATMLAPHRFGTRLELAAALRDAERFDEADPHIRWCLARRPDIRYLHAWLSEAAKRRTLVDQNRRSRRRLYAELAARTATPDPDQSDPQTEPPEKR